MATEKKRNVVAAMSDFGIRAAVAIDSLLPGPHKDKRVARLFGVSVRLAQYLRQGKHWTVDRMSQASRLLGSDFDIALFHAEATRLRQTQDAVIQHLRGGKDGHAHPEGDCDDVDPAGDGGDVAGG
jgi:hypothetical protein